VLHLLPESGLYKPNPKSNLYSIAIHAGAILLLFAFASTKTLPPEIKNAFHLTDPLLAPLSLPSHAGGGGGGHMPLPADKGRLPRIAPRQFVPPQAVPVNQNPRLTMEPTIVAPPDALVPQVNLDTYGDPIGKLGIHSNGTGPCCGIGQGNGPGVGPGKGPGAGPGSGGIGGPEGVFTSGIGGVTAPSVLFQVEPQYSEEARKAKISGVVVLELIVDPNGHARGIHVLHGAGVGLDEKAIEAVQQWRFKPGTKAGKAVPVQARVEVNFRLL
jgi:TonB family protein